VRYLHPDWSAGVLAGWPGAVPAPRASEEHGRANCRSTRRGGGAPFASRGRSCDVLVCKVAAFGAPCACRCAS